MHVGVMKMAGKQQASHSDNGRGLARVVMAGVLLAAGMGVWGGGSTATGSSQVTLQYTCTLSPFPGQPMVAQLTWNAPTSMVVGKSTPTTITVNAVATVGSTVTF